MQRVKQNLIVVVFALVLIAVILLLQWQPWLLLLPVAAIAVGFPIYVLRRTFDLSKKGYFVTNSPKHPVVYEERIGKEIAVVPIPTVMIDEGTYDVIVPSRAEWEKSAPDWAKHRRDEIFRRVIEAHPKECVQLPADWAA